MYFIMATKTLWHTLSRSVSWDGIFACSCLPYVTMISSEIETTGNLQINSPDTTTGKAVSILMPCLQLDERYHETIRSVLSLKL